MISPVFAQVVQNNTPNTLNDFGGVVASVLSAIIPLAAMVLLIMLFWGGFQLMSAGSDPKSAAGAKSTITYAIIGIVIIASAFLIVRLIAIFAFGTAGEAALLDFRIWRN